MNGRFWISEIEGLRQRLRRMRILGSLRRLYIAQCRKEGISVDFEEMREMDEFLYSLPSSHPHRY